MIFVKELVSAILQTALSDAVADGSLALETIPAIDPERPRDAAHGDWASAVALRSAKAAGRAPREIAQVIVDHIGEHPDVESVEIAGPGFINLTLSVHALARVLTDARTQKRDFGRGADKQQYVQVEFVSANPVGPMHVGHGRWAALGDALALVMEHAGYRIQREFLLNDEGHQMDVFAESVAERYLELLGRPFDEDAIGYKGAYIKDIAAEIIAAEGEVWADKDADERRAYFRERSYAQVLEHMKAVLSGFGVQFDHWFSEHTLHVPDGTGQTAIMRTVDFLRQAGYIFDEDGAIWFKSTEFGDDKDRVLIKSDGVATYFAADVAYHADKYSRGFDLVINLWGADHHGYIPRMKAAVAALGHPGQLEVLLGQLVTLMRGGVPVRMSKRTGEMVTFEELIDEVGVDATRYHLVRTSSDQQLVFDIEQVSDQSANNPVYYVQYAHARICSILRKAGGVSGDHSVDIDALADTVIPADADLTLLASDAEIALMRKLTEFADVVERAARDRAPFRLTHYAEELAATLHHFYGHCQVISDDTALTAARLYAMDATRHALACALRLIGISVPVSM
ncbi:MAG: arginine--tRNA ligase [Actinomycetes bacterium]|jgi:arginyl-tRNA synthetase|nr:arginine--tRNA ligase [Actinomycetes bacterium]